jgi:hypothetical protein
MPFEHRTLQLLSRTAYLKRVLRYAGFATIIVGFSLGTGIIGYKYLKEESWLDALVDTSVMLIGTEPASLLETDSIKCFASFYSIFSSVAFLSTVAVFFPPIVHRFLHRLPIDENQ